jgi:hypothetical protein
VVAVIIWTQHKSKETSFSCKPNGESMRMMRCRCAGMLRGARQMVGEREERSEVVFKSFFFKKPGHLQGALNHP